MSTVFTGLLVLLKFSICGIISFKVSLLIKQSLFNMVNHYENYVEQSNVFNRTPTGFFEQVKHSKRQPYWAVPWGMTTRHPEAPEHLSETASNYLSIASDRVGRRFEENFNRAVRTGWITKEQNPSDIRGLVEKTETLRHTIERYVYDPLIMSLYRNDMYNAADRVDMTQPDIQLVAAGLASPDEVIGMLEAYPEVISAEVAKESHPLHFEGARDMNDDISKVLTDRLMSIADYPGLSQYVRTRLSEFSNQNYDSNLEVYKKIHTDINIPVSVVERKKIVGYKEINDEPFVVAQRLRLLVRGDADAVDPGLYLNRDIKMDNRQDRLFSMIRSKMPFVKDGDENLRWLQPIATSYYAYYPGRVPKKPSIATPNQTVLQS